MNDAFAEQFTPNPTGAYTVPPPRIPIRQRSPEPQAQAMVEPISLSARTSNIPRMLFTSPSPQNAIEDSQNEGCNI
jgi:hypothetical protein